MPRRTPTNLLLQPGISDDDFGVVGQASRADASQAVGGTGAPAPSARHSANVEGEEGGGHEPPSLGHPSAEPGAE